MPMSSDMKKCIIFNAIASGLGWAGFGVGISAITSNFWIRDSSSIRIGLWNQCDVNNLCSPLQTGLRQLTVAICFYFVINKLCIAF